MRELQLSDIDFEIEISPEDIPFVGNCSAVDPEVDRETEQWIFNQLDSGNLWAWCSVCVVGRFQSLEARSYLGGCSYPDAEAFRQGGYYDDLCAEVLDLLRDKVQTLQTALGDNGDES